MKRFEYDVVDRIFDTKDPIGDLKIQWFNSLGVEGWEIFAISSAFNADLTQLQVYATMRRELP